MRFLTALLFLLATTVASADTTITYQGQLQDDSGPVDEAVDMTFALFDAETGGSQVGSAIDLTGVSVVDGLFQVDLDFGEQAYASGLWLAIEVEGEPLAPRQAITGAPFAISAAPGTGSNWALSGSNIHYSGGNVGIGTSSPSVTLDVEGSAKFGELLNQATGANSFVAGGATDFPNVAEGLVSFTGGGGGNTASGVASFIGGGENNTASGFRSFIGGSWLSTASGRGGFVGGSDASHASGDWSFVGGGAINAASGVRSFIGGGWNNTANGSNSFVAGGSENSASGFRSFAAGRQAKAEHDGTFVWADNTDAEFASTGEDQFLIRAEGGVGININNPGRALDVEGTIRASGQLQLGSSLFLGSLGGTVGGQEVCRIAATGRLSACSSSSLRYKEDVEDLNNAWDQISAMRAVNYQFIADGQGDLGLIAEELAEIDPRLVVFDAEGRPDSIRYGRLSVVLVAALQERDATMQSRLAELERENIELRGLNERNAELETRLAILEALLLEDRQVTELSP